MSILIQKEKKEKENFTVGYIGRLDLPKEENACLNIFLI